MVMKKLMLLTSMLLVLLVSLLFAAEYTQIQSSVANTADRDAFLVLADYDYTDKIGVALRFS